MADKHPYVPAPGGLEKTINHFRRNLPTAINSDTLKRLGFAPNNESYILNVLRFLKLIDTENKKTDRAAEIFSSHKNEAFFTAFSSVVQDAYSGLFDLHGDNAWNTSREDLITYFRQSDQTSEVVGGRQASTFQLLAKLSGHEESRGRQPQKSKTKETPSGRKKQRNAEITPPIARESTRASIPARDDAASPKIGLTVRIEINLPAVNDQGTYDKIFKSIRENLLNE